MNTLPWLDCANLFGTFIHALPTTTLLLDSQRGNAPIAAEYIAASALCLNRQHNQPCQQCKSCHLLAQKNHPDLIWQNTSGNIDTVRSLSQQTQHTPTIAGQRIIYLADIDRYNDHALNALLKTLEEPPPSNYFILSAPNRRAVKPTILSRARCINIPLANREQAQQWLTECHQLTANDASRLLTLYHGNPFLALNSQQLPDPSEHIQQCIAFFAEPRKNTAWLQHLDSIEQNHLLDYTSSQLSALIRFIQLGCIDDYWQNRLAPHRTSMKQLDLCRLHTVYARLSALRSPQVQQIGMAANIKGHLLDIMDNRIPLL